jgi:1,4-alpha-glucan branching enzyme
VDKQNNITYREWAPNATEAFLIGEFSILPFPADSLERLGLTVADDWSRESYPMKKDPFGVFEVLVPAKDGQPAIAHNSKIKVNHQAIFSAIL